MNYNDILEKLKATLESMQTQTNRLRLYEEAKKAIGENLVFDSPDTSYDERETGCVLAVRAIFRRALGKELCDTASTIVLYRSLLQDARFTKVDSPQKGDIIINPTSFGNGSVTGHVGIYGVDGVMSNDSRDGLKGQWRLNYSYAYWKSWFEKGGGIPTYYFRMV